LDGRRKNVGIPDEVSALRTKVEEDGDIEEEEGDRDV